MHRTQDPDNFPRLQTRKRCALEIAAYVFKEINIMNDNINIFFLKWQGWDGNTTFRASLSAYTDVCKQLFQLYYHNKHASLPFQHVSHTLISTV